MLDNCAGTAPTSPSTMTSILIRTEEQLEEIARQITVVKNRLNGPSPDLCCSEKSPPKPILGLLDTAEINLRHTEFIIKELDGLLDRL